MLNHNSQSQGYQTKRQPGEGLLEAASAMYIITGTIIMLGATFSGVSVLTDIMRTINSRGFGLFLFRPNVVHAMLIAGISAGGAFSAGIMGFRHKPNRGALLVLVALGAFNLPLQPIGLVRVYGLSTFSFYNTALSPMYNLLVFASFAISVIYLTGAIKYRNYHICSKSQHHNEVNHV